MSELSQQSNPQQCMSEIQVSVKNKISQARNLLSSNLILSERPRHILSQTTTDIESESCSNCYLDFSPISKNKNNQFAQQMMRRYGNDLSSLMESQQSIVFMSHAAYQKYQRNIKIPQQKQLYQLGAVRYNLESRDACDIESVKNWCQINQSDIEFADDFQSSNIYMASKETQGTYLVTTRLDYNTYSYGQWFYFKMKNTTLYKKKFKIAIVNMTKAFSMFGRGLKVSVCRNGLWKKEGQDISYEPNLFRRKRCINRETSKTHPFLVSREQFYYTLYFTIEIDSGEQIYVAYNQPYTYSRLGRTIDRILVQNYGREQISIKRSIISRTVLKNCIDMLTITMPCKAGIKPVNERGIIVITARTHPVETAGSFVMQGIIEQLCKAPMDQNVQALLQNYIVKVIPMINPDGVIVGNSRCNIQGYDLNRKWNNPNPSKTPEISAILEMILKSQRRISMFIDLHGHSKKKNVFAYGCHDVTQPFATRQFPYLLSKINQNNFLFKECRFTTPLLRHKAGKQGTARLTLWRKLKIHNIFTIENSYCSAQGSQYHYDDASYKSIGHSILKGICLYFLVQQKSQKVNDLQEQTRFPRLMQRSAILEQLRQDQNNIAMGFLDGQDSQSQKQQRIVEIESIKSKSKLDSKTRLKDSKEKLAISSILHTNLSRNQGAVQNHIQNGYHKLTKSKQKIQNRLKQQRSGNFTGQQKIQKVAVINLANRKLESMLHLRRVPFETDLLRTSSNNQIKYDSMYKNLGPLRRNPYKMTKLSKAQEYQSSNGKVEHVKSSKSIYIRQQNQVLRNSQTMHTLEPKAHMLSIIQFGSRSIFPNTSKAGTPKIDTNSKKRLGIFHREKMLKNINFQKTLQQKRPEPIGVYNIVNAFKRPNYNKLHDLIIKINRNKHSNTETHQY